MDFFMDQQNILVGLSVLEIGLLIKVVFDQGVIKTTLKFHDRIINPLSTSKGKEPKC